ncbi:glycoside hydrolase domain-containing protein [Fulvivirga sediminis]|uniref:Glycoside hydrolase family 92 protein n=1 Tax=Fulvivirga sediminis TaxID=2803949 RepID=A0A937FAI0_9BACT|nr:glycoside hydrolase domain-containing protein [Fulvivirga sediminis]MBL3657614.1 glycoside hydrolase family 92 protein [Fulvivirga sediminis]
MPSVNQPFKALSIFIFSVIYQVTFSQSDQVNVFLGTSGDHGQMSPAASYPFSMLSIGPQTYPATHPGYEYYAKEYLGFTHNRMEGVGCQGDGGNILVKPFTSGNYKEKLIKKSEDGSAGYYGVRFKNGIQAEFTVNEKQGLHHYAFTNSNNGVFIDLGHAFVGRFKEEQHKIVGNTLHGYIVSGTTCSRGFYKIYYSIYFNKAVEFQKVANHQLLAKLDPEVKDLEMRIAFSSVDVEHAQKSINTKTFDQLKAATTEAWNEQLGQIEVRGSKEREDLFYSLLYRALQSPFVISESDHSYTAIDGSLQKSKNTFYNGWAIWDNYKTQLPLLSLAYTDQYGDMMWSVQEMYKHGKKDFSTDHEPSQTVRTEHAVVVLLDAYRKGYKIDFDAIADSLISENNRFDYSTPDKALEGAYDDWALSEIFEILKNEEQAKKYEAKALKYKDYWKNDFEDLTKNDIDRMGAREMYQGTVWQYRWLVPYDVQGLIELCGGEEAYLAQLDEFFEGDYYNHANEPDIQVPWMYHGTSQPWKSQELIHKIAVDTVNQFYFNNNSKGIDPFVGKIYINKPKAFLRTMDDDAGALSGWFVLAGAGITPACVGWPVYYVHVPLFEKVILNKNTRRSFTIEVENFGEENIYIKSLTFNGKLLKRNWLTHEEIMNGGLLQIEATDEPVKKPYADQWITALDQN